MRRMLPMLLMLAAAGCDLTGIDWSGIDDWEMPGGGPGGCGYCPSPPAATIRPVVTADVVFSSGSAFQLEVLDSLGNPVVDPPGTFHSADTMVLAVSPTGWAEARSPGSATVRYGVEGGVSASAVFSVGVPPSTSALRLDVHGLSGECGYPFNCAPAGSPIIEGWIGHSTDIRGVSLTFIGAGSLQPTDQVSASPIPLALCQASDFCVSVTDPSPAYAWSPGEETLCIGVAVGDSVPEQAYEDANNREWVVTWSRPGQFVLRQTFSVYVRPALSAPASAC
jgi:hypothetical protein